MSTRIHVLLATAWVLASCAGQSPPDPAVRPDRLNLDLAELVETSNLVFVGQVSDVTYRVSQPDCSGCSGVPYTLVTYRIDNLLRGKAPAGTFTMRLTGGADGRGGFLHVSNQPTVSVGDRDFLFVAGNGTEGCPLVQCKRGRFRIHQDSVHGGDGVPVRQLDGTTVVTSGEPPAQLSRVTFPTPAFDVLAGQSAVQAWIRQSGIDPQVLRERYAAEAPQRIEIYTARPPTQGPPGDLLPSLGTVSPRPFEQQGAVQTDAFVRAVEAIIAQTRRRALPVAFLKVTEFPDAGLSTSGISPNISPEILRAVRDDREVEAFERNNRNPVLGAPDG